MPTTPRCYHCSAPLTDVPDEVRDDPYPGLCGECAGEDPTEPVDQLRPPA